MTFFRDRADAGRQLAERLSSYRGRQDVLVLALPRGGVPVGYEVADVLQVPLDVFLVRKLGVPGHEELAMGAVASGGVRVVNPDVLEQLHIPQRVLDAVTIEEQRELERRERAYRGLKPPLNVNGWTAIVVDDGLATGSSMRAAASALRLQGPAQIIVGVPVAARATCDDLSREVDQVVCVLTPEPFYAVGLWYQDFRQITDEEVRQLLTTLAPPPTRQAA